MVLTYWTTVWCSRNFKFTYVNYIAPSHRIHLTFSEKESRDKHHGLGFYQEHYTSVEEMAAQTMQAMSNQSRAAANMAGNSVATTAAAGLFDPHSQSTMNYALKPEKGLPPTPPGSPGEGTPSSQQQLAKPVPMRRPEKSVSQARVAMTNSYEASLYEHSAAIYGHDNPEVALRSVVVKMVIVTAWVEAYRGMRLTKLRSQS
uniref:Uncharacterized protein n=1 Tax=Magallana gigas TaxID=29159 RepID=K1PPG1_MAGGI